MPIDIVLAAITQYAADCEKEGVIFQQPSRYESEVDSDCVILRNSYQELARYQIEESIGRLRLMRLIAE